MFMVGYRYIIFFSILILTSCAQVGTITGGDQDTNAPKPIADKVVPQNGSTNFNGNHVEMPFDEFFQLNNPNENVVMVPPHAKVNAGFKGKTLFLDWEDTLQENTTYAIYLNNAIKDLTEGNDSIIQYVFSTGDVLDTLFYEIQVRDAWSNKPVSNAIVVLYDKGTDELKSFAATNNNGIASLNYLKAGEYKLLAFKDENGDLEYQEHEAVAFDESEGFTLLESRVDSIAYRMFSPILEPKITTKSFIGPNSYFIAANRSLENTSFTINGINIPKEQQMFLAEDSVQLFWNTDTVTKAEIIVKNETFNDTISLRYSKRTTQAPLLLSSVNKSNIYAPSEPVAFQLNDLISSVDTSLIEILNIDDSTLIKNYNTNVTGNKISFELNKTDLSRLRFEFKTNSVVGMRDSLSKIPFVISLNPARKYGSINLNLSYYERPIILQTIKDNKLVSEVAIEAPSKDYLIEELAPGQYTFIVVEDDNTNGKWDVGNLEDRSQPETLDVYSTPTKVRANWEVELELIPAE